MKRNIKKTALFVVVATVVIFAVASMASAWWFPHMRYLVGKYEVTGRTQCLSSSSFTDKFTLPTGAVLNGLFATPPVSVSESVIEGVYTFNYDGTGKFEGTMRSLVQPPSTAPLPPLAAAATFTWYFDYSVGHDGEITFSNTEQHSTATLGPQAGCITLGNNGPTHGRISRDGYELTITCGPGAPNPIIVSTTTCNGNPAGTAQLLCAINLVGHRQ